MLNKFDYTVSAGYENAELACDIREKRLKKEVESFLEGKDLRPAQQFMKEHMDDSLVVIAPTGSGKTEAALLWLDGEKGFYTLPLKVSSNAIYSRIKNGYGYEHAAILHSDSMAMYLKENPGSAWEKQEQAKPVRGQNLLEWYEALISAALVLVLGGGIGNLIDRVLNGEVVDYINLLFMRFAVFNFADICVCVGVALWVLVIFLDEVHADDAASKEQ